MALDVTIAGADAEAYLSVADASTYHAARGNAAWAAAASDTVREQALRRGTEYLDSVFVKRFKGIKATSGQALQWPRVDVVDESGYYVASDAIPTPIERANAELALRALSEDLFPDLARGGDIESVKAGEVVVKFGKAATPYKIYREVESILAELLESRTRLRLA